MQKNQELKIFCFILKIFFSFAGPSVQPLLVGSAKVIGSNPYVVDLEGSVTLVVSKGKYILFDTGTIGMRKKSKIIQKTFISFPEEKKGNF